MRSGSRSRSASPTLRLRNLRTDAHADEDPRRPRRLPRTGPRVRRRATCARSSRGDRAKADPTPTPTHALAPPCMTEVRTTTTKTRQSGSRRRPTSSSTRAAPDAARAGSVPGRDDPADQGHCRRRGCDREQLDSPCSRREVARTTRRRTARFAQLTSHQLARAAFRSTQRTSSATGTRTVRVPRRTTRSSGRMCSSK